MKKAFFLNGIIYSSNIYLKLYLFFFFKSAKMLLNLFYQAWAAFLYILGVYNKSTYLKKAFSFLEKTRNSKEKLSAFIKKEKNKFDISELNASSDIVICRLPKSVGDAIKQELGINVIFSEDSAFIAEELKENYELYCQNPEENEIFANAAKVLVLKNGSFVPLSEYKPSLIARFFTRDFLSFLMIGVINTLNGIIFSYVYSLFLQENVAFICGYMSGLLISYLLNSFITFKEKLSIMKFIKYFISYLPNFLIQNGCVILLFNILGLPKLLVYALAAIIGIPVTFIILKLFAFKKKKA